MKHVLEYAVKFLQKQHGSSDRPASCQQAIILLTDTIEGNYTEQVRYFDPEGKIR